MQTHMGKRDRKKGNLTAMLARDTAFPQCYRMEVGSLVVQGRAMMKLSTLYFSLALSLPCFVENWPRFRGHFLVR